MIGVDIVDLSDPLLKYRNHRALKLVTNPEDQLINHPQLFWILWCAKEAIFKSRRTTDPFIPTEVPIHLNEKSKKIYFTSNELIGEVIIRDKSILAWCHKRDQSPKIHAYHDQTLDWSNTIREKIRQTFKGQVSISSNDGIPIIDPGNIPISISHHGAFGAFAYLQD